MFLAATSAAVARIVPQFTLNSATIVVATIMLVLLICEEMRRGKKKRPSPSPSYQGSGTKVLTGPWGLPLLGNILQLGSSPHETFVKMARKYGDVFQIYIGSTPVVVINGYDTIRQALVKQSVDFAGRPDLPSSQCATNILGKTLGFSTYSEGWKLHRKITETAIRHFTSGSQLKSVGERISREVKELTSAWLAQPISTGSSKKKTDHFNLLRVSVSNVMYSYIFGKRHSLNDQKLLDFVAMSDDFSKAIGSSNAADFMPWLTMFSKIYENFTKMMQTYKGWFGKDISEHTKYYQDGSEANILDYLITANRKMDPENMKRLQLTEENIVNTVYDMFGAGFDTVSGIVQWAVAMMIINPEVQREVQRELDTVIGRDRLPCAADRGRLPLTESCLLEVIRFSSAVPLTIPHSTTKDTGLNGYFIPKDTLVFINLHSVHYDAEIWDEPAEFRYRRFVKEDGTGLDPDKTTRVMPYGAGKRRCVGSELAKLETFLYFTTLLHQCTFSTPDCKKPKLQRNPGLVQKPGSFDMTVRRREPQTP